MYNLLTGQLPFDNICKDKEKIYQQIVNNDFGFPDSPKISNVAQDLIRQILVKDPKKRPGLNQILYHDFFHVAKFPRLLDISTYYNKPTIPEAEKERFNKEIVNKCLYKLIVNNNIEIKYEDIDTYITNKDDDNFKDKSIDYWVTIFRKTHKGFYYYEMNNNLKGIIFQQDYEEIKEIKLLLNEKADEFYEIKKYKIKECPEDLKPQLQIFLDYCKKFKKMKEEYFNHKNISKETKEDFSIIKQDLISSLTNINHESDDNKNTETTVEYTEEITEEEKKVIYIKSFSKQKYATFLVLSDNVKQYKFDDEIDIFISEDNEIAQYVDSRHNEKTVVSLINVTKNSNKVFQKRLKYIGKINLKELQKTLQDKTG